MTVSDFLLMGVGGDGVGVPSTAAADPQLQFFENLPAKAGAAFNAYSNLTLSVHAVNIPLSLSLNSVVVLVSGDDNARKFNLHFGLYSLNGSTLSLANSASTSSSGPVNGVSWISMETSATQNISPGAWYFAFNVSTFSGNANFSFFGNSTVNPGNAQPTLVMGRMTVSTNAMPGSIATSNLDITGSDSIRQPFIIITA